ncbi:unnamed protein product [Arabis nemorensis]|uniref:Bifunctional inhibitor/plant lipid transfer protein/seed storage helical domain-containing protein n=1 Tax=Arabis nemorensis TaxID=586526 RepID=A0A565C2Q0_9BRAS|nr:unnamed protein product [Arabis nemorensis]
MGKNTITLMQFAMVLIAAMLVKEAMSIPICNINTNDLEKCRPAVAGRNPPPPGPDCCAVVKAANLVCACMYKSYLANYGINPSRVKAVIASCGARIPSCLPR